MPRVLLIGDSITRGWEYTEDDYLKSYPSFVDTIRLHRKCPRAILPLLTGRRTERDATLACA